ncbi:MAG TPA: cobamide remodeling phosphodiesterase CbiR [Smithellaceae bacterium]|nr:cobamide remodeling phosphodiesterase CbiR [Smithellaceae bacterium]
MTNYSFRLGTTSYILPDDIIPNVRYLAGKVRDVELLLFEVEDGSSNLPDCGQIAELRKIAADHDMTYTVHLPLDLRLVDDGTACHASMEKARRVIETTRELGPWAYVLHLDGKSVRDGAAPEAMKRWLDQTIHSLEIVGEWAGGAEKLAVENLEGYPLDFYRPVLERITVSLAVDVGHLWLDGYDPVVYLQKVLPRTRVIHIHGIDGRDHQSLANMPAKSLRAVLEELVSNDYQGVLTVEVFSEDDFLTSIVAIRKAMALLEAKHASEDEEKTRIF